jgi:hypothetical protein
MVPEANSVDDVPLVDGIEGPEGLADVVEDGADGREGVVDENVEFPVFVLLDCPEEFFDFGIVGMVHLVDNVIKLFTAVIYCHSVVMPSFCVIKQHYDSKLLRYFNPRNNRFFYHGIFLILVPVANVIKQYCGKLPLYF